MQTILANMVAIKNQASTLLQIKWIHAAGTAFLSIGFALLLGSMPLFKTLELRITDLLFQWRGPLDISDSPVVLVAISDQADLEIPETWPWPRSYHARLVDNLHAAGAHVIGFDVTFLQADEYHPANDSLFAAAITRHGNVVLAGDIRTGRRGGGAQVIQYLPPLRSLLHHDPRSWGYISHPLDSDGFIRRHELSRLHLDSRYYAFGLELIRRYKSLDTLFIQDTGTHFDLGFVRIPKYDHRTMLINYHGPGGTFPEFSYEQIIDDGNMLLTSDRDFFGMTHPDEKDYGDFDDPEYGLLHSGQFKDKIVIVGATIPELQDFHPTSFSPEFPGYEIHANTIQTILGEQFISRAGTSAFLLFLILPVVIICFLTIYKGVIAGFFAMLLLAFLLVISVALLFTVYSVRLELVLPLLPPLFGYVSSSSYRFLTELLEKRRIRNLFGSYVSPDLVDTMIEKGEEPQLGGNEVFITAFFSDIQSFSAFSEKLNPTSLVELINEYLSGMTDILTEERGTLDKYIGDAIVAFFGAPLPVRDHALRACITSQRMLLKQKELCAKWKKEGHRWPRIVGQMQTRIGINTGNMVTGNMGSATRFNYTIMGDNVNLAARCESGAKAYGVYTMVTEATRREAEKFGNDCVFRYLDKTVVMGRTKPEKLFEIVGLRSLLDEDTFECLDIFSAGIDAYLSQDWVRAETLFARSARLEPHQPAPGIQTNPSLVMIERCKHLAANPPEDSWDGIFVMKSK